MILEMLAFPVGGWEQERENWKVFLERFESEIYEPVFKPAGFSKNSALQAYFANVMNNIIFNSCSCDKDDEEGEGWHKG